LAARHPYAADDAELRATAEREVDRVPYYPQGIARQLVGILASPPRHEMLAKVKCPALVIHGEAIPSLTSPADATRPRPFLARAS